MTNKTQLKGSIFITVKELMILTGKNNYESCRREHQAIRDGFEAKKES